MRTTAHRTDWKPMGLAPSATRNKIVNVRLNEKENDVLRATSERLGMSMSGVVRALVTLPIEVQDEWIDQKDPSMVVAFDRASIAHLTKQIRMLGYHYDQAVHALNTLAAKKFVRVGEAEQYMERAVALLEGIESTRQELEAEASVLSMKALVYMPIGRDR